MKEELKKLVAIRTGEDTDHNFIYATWLRGLYYGNSIYGAMEKDAFMDFYKLKVTSVLFKPSVTIQIACLKEEPDTILGYSVLESFEVPHGTAAHWAFVKPEWRKCGIATALIPEATETITHVVDSLFKVKLDTKSKSDKWLSNYEIKLKNKKFKYNPFLI